MTDEDLVRSAHGVAVACPPAKAAEEHPKPKPLSRSDAVNWLRYLAKCKARLSEASYGGNEQSLSFQAHVMREAARHLESSNH